MWYRVVRGLGESGLRVSAVVHGLRCVGQAACAAMPSTEPCWSPFASTPLYSTVCTFEFVSGVPCMHGQAGHVDPYDSCTLRGVEQLP